MATTPPFLTTFITLLVLLLHLGCFTLFPTSRHRRRKPPSPTHLRRTSSTKLKRHKPISSTWSFIKQVFSSKPRSQIEITDGNSTIFHQLTSPTSSARSISIIQPDPTPTTRPGSDYIHPCRSCGEIFQKPGLLEHHQSVKHAVCELPDSDPGKNIVRIIFETGWPVGKNPVVINRVMKIHNSPKILARFEEYREAVKSAAAARHHGGGARRRDERCIADGNELLRFHCATFICDLGQNGNSSICSHQYCNVCGIIGSGFSPKLDGISTLSSGWRGHVAVPEDIEEEFGFMNVKRAMLVCRVIAGRVGCDPGMGDKEDPGYDSLVGGELPGASRSRLDDEDELIVFNPRAVLPCFVIAYTVGL